MMLAYYKSYLQSVYNARALAPADKYLPTLAAPYINLAMIIRRRYDTELRDEFTRRTLHGGVDQILQSKVPIEIEDLLTFEWKDDYLFILPYLKALIRQFKSGSITPEDVNLAHYSSECYLSELNVKFELTRKGILQTKKSINIEVLLTFDWKDNYLSILPFLKALVQKSTKSRRHRPDLLTQ